MMNPDDFSFSNFSDDCPRIDARLSSPSSLPSPKETPPIDRFSSERHKYLYERLKSMINEELSFEMQKRITDHLLLELAASLLDQTVLNILIMLRLQQKNKEHELMKQRDSMILKLDAKRKTKIEEVEKQFSQGEITSFKRDELLKEMKKHYEEKIISIDIDILHQVDKNVREQQKTLMDAQIPGFYVTNKSQEIEVQVKLLKFITQIDDLCDESRLSID